VLRSAFRLGFTLFAVTLFFGSLVCFGQANATIEGYVFDAGGSAIPGAQVEVRNTTTGIVRQTQSDSGGRYLVSSLIPATYEVAVSASGFTKKVISGG